MILPELLEIVLVTSSLVLDLTNLLDLILVDSQSLVVNSEVLLGRRSFIWFLEAYESVKLLTLSRRMHLKAFDFTIGGKKSTKIIFCPGLREAFDIKIASLLGALVLDGLSETLSFTISSLESFLHVKLLVVWKSLSVDDRLTVELGNSFLSTLWSVLTVLLVLRVEADESVFTFIIGHKLHALNATELSEE